MPWQAHWGASGEAEDLAAGRSLTCPLTTSAPRRRPRSRSCSPSWARIRAGRWDLGQAVFLPESVRIAEVTGELGGSARPGAQVLYATSDTP